MSTEVELQQSDIDKITAVRDKLAKQLLKIGELYSNKHKFSEIIKKIETDLQKEIRQEEVYREEEKELVNELSAKYGNGQADLERKKFIKND
jgi:hypothetical protein